MIKMKIKTKLMLFILVSFIVIFSLTIGYIAKTTRKEAVKSATELNRSIAESVQQSSEKYFQNGVDAARNFAQVLVSLKKQKLTDRSISNEIMMNMLKENKEILSLWCLWEPNAYDGKDKSYKNQVDNDSTGRYILGANRGKNSLSFDKALNYEVEGDGDYYLMARKTKKEVIVEPYLYFYTSDQTKGYFETSFAVPILENNRFMGASGIDIDLKKLCTINKESNQFDDGSIITISSSLTVAAAPDTSMLGKSLKSYEPENFEKIKQALTNNEELIYETTNKKTNKKYFSFVMPMKVGNSPGSWAVIVSVSADEALAGANKQLRFIIFLGFIGIFIFAGIAFLIARSITAPILKSVWLAKKIAQGKLNVAIDIKQQDEIGELADALNEMVSKLKGIADEIKSGAQYISLSSGEISRAAQQVSTGSSQQAAATEEASASMEQMAANIAQSNESAIETEKIAIHAFEGIKKAKSAVEFTMQRMNEIVNKVAVIDDIANRTDMLAVNAAIEAARAGMAGKGFAVVANEIRKLAEHSKRAAQQIDEMSKSSVGMAAETQNFFNDILPAMEKTAQLIQEITAAANEQNSGASQINSAIQQLNSVTQQNAATSEQLATNAEEMNSQSERFIRTISFFKTDDRKTSKMSLRRKNRTQKFKSPVDEPKKQTGGLTIRMDEDETQFEKF